MTLAWIVLVLGGWGLGLAFALIALRMVGNQDRAERHQYKSMNPNSDVTIALKAMTH